VADYLIDTYHLNRLIDPRHPFQARFIARLRAGDTFSTILPIITETVFGFSILPRAARNWTEWHTIRPSLMLLPLDETDALDAAALQWPTPPGTAAGDGRRFDCHDRLVL